MVARLLLALALCLQGCGTVEPVSRPGEIVRPGILAPWLALTGGWAVSRGEPSRSAARIQLELPTGVAASGNEVIIADAARRQVLRYDRARDSITLSIPTGTLPLGQPAPLALAPDLSVFVADPGGRVVRQYDRDGRIRQTFADDANLGRPIALAFAAARGELLVADGLNNQIVVFSTLGRAQRLLGARDPLPVQSIAALAIGPDGVYLLDRQAQQVVVMSYTGQMRYAFGEDVLIQPRAIAVDRTNRVFVSDDADQSIKVFLAGELIGAMGSLGAAPGRFNQITSLAADENLLYVADSGNRRVQILLITPESMRPKGEGK